MNSTPIARAQWPRAWAAAPARNVIDLATDLSKQHQVEDLSLPQSGLGLMPLSDSALNDTYFLGELPLAHAHVRVQDADGNTADGGALILDDRTDMARAIAILDAVLAGRLHGHERVSALVAQGWQEVQRITQERKAILSATRVDFALLGTAEEEEPHA